MEYRGGYARFTTEALAPASRPATGANLEA